MNRLNAHRTLTVLLLAALTAIPVGCAGPEDGAANEAFEAAIGATTITVYPAFVRRNETNSHDTGAAERISAFLQTERLASATVTDERVPIDGPWRVNQLRMLRNSAATFADYVVDHPIETDYALLPEYLGGSSAFGGVDGYVVTADGRVAYVVLQNSHWPIYQDVNPKTVDDCTKILTRCLLDDLARHRDDH